MTNRHLLLIPVLGVSLLLGSCLGGLSKTYPEIRLYTLDPVRPQQASQQADPASLTVGAFTASPGARDTGFLLRRSQNRVEQDYFNRFAVLPPELIQDKTAAWLRKGALFADVRTSNAAAHSWTLTGHVLRLEGDFTSKAPAAVMELQFLLTPSAKTPQGISFFKTYEQRVDLEDSSPEALAQGWEQALAHILATMETEVAAHIAATPE